MLLFLFACAAPVEDTGKPLDTDTDTVDTDTEDTDTVPVTDDDHDGYDSTVDCNDRSYQVYPGAPELCDGVDNDCDGEIDEDFDADGDGAFAPECEGGLDCDDTDASFGPDAEEVPYDGLDQDCDGSDLVDVDGDGYRGDEGGLDCDDTDPTIKPGAEEIPKDGIDQDCDGADDLDGDADGYDDAELGGDDCDDADPAIHPGAFDWWNDGLDTDCDDHDNGLAALEDAPVSIAGVSAEQDLVGQDVAVCDLDGDTLLDLVIAAPFGASYAGQVGIFYGANAASWTAGMLLSDADTLIESREQFLGFELGCADIDGDGYDDLVTGRGEIHYGSTYETDFELVVWYGTGTAFDATLDELDADARFEMSLGVTRNLTNVYGRTFLLADIDDSGGADIVLVNGEGTDLADVYDSFWVLDGARYAGNYQLDEAARAVILADGPSFAAALPDLDGNGAPELVLGESGWEDPEDTGAGYLGRVSALDADTVASDTVDALAWGGWTGATDLELGYALVSGDFDGDGLLDIVTSALADDTLAETGGGLYLYAPAEAAVPSAGTSADATAAIYGATEAGYLGFALARAPDVDGDGADELLVSEPYAEGGVGRVWLVSGALFAGGADIESAALLAWYGEAVDALTGNALAVGDLDGDGIDDYVVGAYGYAEDGVSANGKVYVIFGQ